MRVRARRAWPVTSGGPGRGAGSQAAALAHRYPGAPVVVQGPAGRLGGVGGAPAAGRQARDELRGQPPRDAPQVQLLPQQGLELPAAALGTTKGALAPPADAGGCRRGPGGAEAGGAAARAVLGLSGVQVGAVRGAVQGRGARRPARPAARAQDSRPDQPVQLGAGGRPGGSPGFVTSCEGSLLWASDSCLYD